MRNFDIRDVIGGVLLVAVGGFAAGYALASYEFGTSQRIGPAMMPAALGVALATIGPSRPSTVARGRPAAGDRLAADGRDHRLGCRVRARHRVVRPPAGDRRAGGSVRARQPLSAALPTAVLAVCLGTMSIAVFRGVLGIYMPLVVWPLL